MDKKQLKLYKSTFHFGASISYNQILIRECGEHIDFNSWNPKIQKVWKEKIVELRTGIVIGWKWLSNGVVKFSQDGGNSYTSNQSIFAIEIKRGMMNKVDLVLPESLTIHELTKNFIIKENGTCIFLGRLIGIPDHISTMSDKDRQWLSNVMKSVPRDSKGRWK